MAPRIINLGQWRAHLLRDLAAQVDATGDERCDALDELRALPGPGGRARRRTTSSSRCEIADGSELRFLSTRTTFGTALDVTVSELAIESFFPADDRRGTVHDASR